MKLLKTLFLFACVGLLLFSACNKSETPTPADNKEEQILFEQNAGEQFGISYSLINEILFLTARQALLTPELHGLQGDERAEDRSACPNTTFIPAMGGGDTLMLDFGAGCTISNGGGNGPTIAGEILLISFGSLNTNYESVYSV